MNLNNLKIELSNAITAELAKSMKSHEGMMSHYALNFMESGDEEHRASYLRFKGKYESMKMSIDIVQQTSRDFAFEEEGETK